VARRLSGVGERHVDEPFDLVTGAATARFYEDRN
jgi:hypothetical protein